MRNIAQITAILGGYVALSFAVLKVLWTFYGVHFYQSSAAHTPQAHISLDIVLIAILALGGLLLVLLRWVILSLMSVFVVCLFEAAFLHEGHHEFWQLLVLIIVATGLVTALYINLLWIALDGNFLKRPIKPSGF